MSTNLADVASAVLALPSPPAYRSAAIPCQLPYIHTSAPLFAHGALGRRATAYERGRANHSEAQPRAGNNASAWRMPALRAWRGARGAAARGGMLQYACCATTMLYLRLSKYLCHAWLAGIPGRAWHFSWPAYAFSLTMPSYSALLPPPTYHPTLPTTFSPQHAVLPRSPAPNPTDAFCAPTNSACRAAVFGWFDPAHPTERHSGTGVRRTRLPTHTLYRYRTRTP